MSLNLCWHCSRWWPRRCWVWIWWQFWPEQMVDRASVHFPDICLIHLNFQVLWQREAKETSRGGVWEWWRARCQEGNAKRHIWWVLNDLFFLQYVPLEGVDNRKFYAMKRDPKSEEEIAKTNDEDDVSKRQAVFDANQSALMHQIRWRLNLYFLSFGTWI